MYDLSDNTSMSGSPGFGSPILGGSTHSLTGHSSAPELLVSLCYASLTGRLTVEVLKASNLRYLQLQRAPGKGLIIIITQFLLIYGHTKFPIYILRNQT